MRTTKPMTTNERVMHTFQDDFQKAIEKMDELHALCNEDARIASQHDDDFQKAIEKMEQLHALCNEDARIASHHADRARGPPWTSHLYENLAYAMLPFVSLTRKKRTQPEPVLSSKPDESATTGHRIHFRRYAWNRP